MLKAVVLTCVFAFSTLAAADGSLKSDISKSIFTKFKVGKKQAVIEVRGDCRWPSADASKARCELTMGKQAVTLTGQEAVQFRDQALKAGAGESPGGGSTSFRDAQILNCTRTETIGYYTEKAGKKVWVDPSQAYNCQVSAEPSVGPPTELDVVPPTGTTGR